MSAAERQVAPRTLAGGPVMVELQAWPRVLTVWPEPVMLTSPMALLFRVVRVWLVPAMWTGPDLVLPQVLPDQAPFPAVPAGVLPRAARIEVELPEAGRESE